jgi:hypothetical protein
MAGIAFHSLKTSSRTKTKSHLTTTTTARRPMQVVAMWLCILLGAWVEMSESNPAFRPNHFPTGTPTEEPTARSVTGFTNPDREPEATGDLGNSKKQGQH